MDFSLTEDQSMIVSTIEKLCSDFDDEYWLARDLLPVLVSDFGSGYPLRA